MCWIIKFRAVSLVKIGFLVLAECTIMDMFTTIYVFFMLFGTVHATAWKPKTYIPGDNVTVHFDQLDINETNVLEITFSGSTSKLHVSNVMLYTPMKNKTDIHINYAGRIQRVELNKDGLKFILLNVSFIDSGNYSVIEHSLEKGKTSIIVPRQRLLGQNNEPVILSFTCNMTNVTSIKTEMTISKQHHFVLKYDVASENYTDNGGLYRDRIKSCVLKGNIFSFTIRNVTLTDMGMYVAWSDMNILMDSVLLEFKGITTSSPTSTPIYFISSSAPNILNSGEENYMIEWIIVSAVVFLLVAAGLIAKTLRILLNRTISKTTSNHLTHRNGRQNIANSSCRMFNNTEIRHVIDGNTMLLRENNISHALTDCTHAQNQDNVTANGKQSCKRNKYSAQSIVSKVIMHPILSSSCETLESELKDEYDRVQYDEMTNEYRSDQPHVPLN